MNINELIDQLAKQNMSEHFTASVAYGVMRGKTLEIDQALKNANEEDRFSLAVNLFRLWFEAGMCREQERLEEAKSVFGEIFEKHGGRYVMYTLTADRKQLRVWYGRPACMAPDHVDSCGHNLLFGVYGHPEVVQRYLKAFREIHNLDEIRVPNGVLLYMHWSDR